MCEVPLPVLGQDPTAAATTPIKLCACGCGGVVPPGRRDYRTRFLVGHKRPIDPVASFWKYVNKTDTCWLWTGKLHNTGYGVHRPVGRIEVTTHRFSWELHFGPIPEGKCVLHRCDVRNCVRPDHLFLGTRRDNMEDAAAKGRMRSRRFSVQQREEILRRFKGGESQTSLAEEFGVVPNYIGYLAKHYDPSYVPDLAKGERHSRAKLTNDKVIEIRQRSEMGERPLDLAQEFSVLPCTIINIVKRRLWKHLI
jgi:hypothetical protein